MALGIAITKSDDLMGHRFQGGLSEDKARA